jgi:hypothetical protein
MLLTYIDCEGPVRISGLCGNFEHIFANTFLVTFFMLTLRVDSFSEAWGLV